MFDPPIEEFTKSWKTENQFNLKMTDSNREKNYQVGRVRLVELFLINTLVKKELTKTMLKLERMLSLTLN